MLLDWRYQMLTNKALNVCSSSSESLAERNGIRKLSAPLLSSAFISATDPASGYGRNSIPCHGGRVCLSEDLWLHFLTCRWCGQLGLRPTTTCCFQLAKATHTQMCSHVNTQGSEHANTDEDCGWPAVTCEGTEGRVVFEVGGKRRNYRDNSLLLQLK